MTATASVPFTPPAPKPRYIPPNAKPSLQGYLRYLTIMARNPLEIFTEANFEGFLQPSRVFGQRYALVHDPEAIRRYLVTNAENYGLTQLRKDMFEPLIGKGLLIAEGTTWTHTRGALTPVFNHRNVRSFAPTMKAVIDREADEIAARDGQGVAMSSQMLGLALNVLTACLFSGDTAIDTDRFSKNLDQLLDIAGMPHPLDLMSAPVWVPRVGRGQAKRIVRELRDQVGAVLTARRKEERVAENNDFLSLLISAGVKEGAPLTDDEIIDNLITFLAAGHETTARTLTWTFYLLSKAQDATARVQSEIDAAGLDHIAPEDWAKALPFTVAVIKESMRLYPAAAIFSRLALGPDRLCDTDIAAGTEIITAPWVLHRHKKLWDNPNRFDPDRFLEERGEAIPRHAYMPFGAGPRICIGASFSMQEMVIIVATFMERMRFKHIGGTEPQPIMRITIQPSTPVHLRVERR